MLRFGISLKDKNPSNGGDIRTILKAVPNFEETLEKLDWRKCQNEYDRNVKLYTDEGEAYLSQLPSLEQVLLVAGITSPEVREQYVKLLVDEGFEMPFLMLGLCGIAIPSGTTTD